MHIFQNQIGQAGLPSGCGPTPLPLLGIHDRNARVSFLPNVTQKKKKNQNQIG